MPTQLHFWTQTILSHLHFLSKQFHEYFLNFQYLSKWKYLNKSQRYKNLNMNLQSFAHIVGIKKLQNPGFFNIIPNLFLHHICQVQLISGIYLLIYGPNLNRIIGIELKWHGNGNLLCLNLNSNNQTIIRLFGSVLPIHRHHQALKWKKEEIFKGELTFISK